MWLCSALCGCAVHCVVVHCIVWLCGFVVHCATFNLISGHDREATVPTLQCRAVPIAKMSQHNFIFFSALIDTREEKTFLREQNCPFVIFALGLKFTECCELVILFVFLYDDIMLCVMVGLGYIVRGS